MAEPPFTIRPASVADVAVILGFIHELAAFEQLSHEVVADEASLRDTLFGDRAYAEVLLAERAGDVVGFALFFHNFSTFLGRPGIYLEDLYVRPESRGRGIGTALLSTIAGLAVERNCGRLEWSVLDWNDKAIGLYEQLGAAPMSEWTGYRLTGHALRDLAARGD